MATAQEHLDNAKDWLKKGLALAPTVNNNYNDCAYDECGKAIDAMGTTDAALLQYKDEINRTGKASETIPNLIAEIEAKMP